MSEQEKITSLQSALEDLTSGDDARAEAAVQVLRGRGPRTVDALGSLLRSDKTDDRWWAARALAAMERPEATAYLLHAVDDPDEQVRECIVLGLGERHASEAIGSIIPLLASEDLMMARLSIDALVKIGKPAVASLTDALQHPDPQVRSGAARALATVADPKSIPALMSVIEDESALVRYWAEQGLDKMGVTQVYFRV